MKRILIVGSCGAGKSTFARKLHERTGLELVHLDQEYWLPNWTRPEREDFRQKVAELVRKESWIMDGNYRNTLDIRFPTADTVIFLDPSRWTCFARIFKRWLRNDRRDRLEGCRERVTFELMKWVLWRFPHESRPELLAMIRKNSENKEALILHSQKEIDEFLRSL